MHKGGTGGMYPLRLATVNFWGHSLLTQPPLAVGGPHSLLPTAQTAAVGGPHSPPPHPCHHRCLRVVTMFRRHAFLCVCVCICVYMTITQYVRVCMCTWSFIFYKQFPTTDFFYFLIFGGKVIMLVVVCESECDGNRTWWICYWGPWQTLYFHVISFTIKHGISHEVITINVLT